MRLTQAWRYLLHQPKDLALTRQALQGDPFLALALRAMDPRIAPQRPPGGPLAHFLARFAKA